MFQTLDSCYTRNPTKLFLLHGLQYNLPTYLPYKEPFFLSPRSFSLSFPLQSAQLVPISNEHSFFHPIWFWTLIDVHKYVHLQTAAYLILNNRGNTTCHLPMKLNLIKNCINLCCMTWWREYCRTDGVDSWKG